MGVVAAIHAERVGRSVAEGVERVCELREGDVHLAIVGETVILLRPPSPFRRCFNMDGEGMSAK